MWRLIKLGTSEEICISKDPFILGRNNNADIILYEPFVSRNHASLTLRNQNLYVIDNQTSNGTFVNNAKIAPGIETQLSIGDIVTFGCLYDNDQNLSVSRYKVTRDDVIEIVSSNSSDKTPDKLENIQEFLDSVIPPESNVDIPQNEKPSEIETTKASMSKNVTIDFTFENSKIKDVEISNTLKNSIVYDHVIPKKETINHDLNEVLSKKQEICEEIMKERQRSVSSNGSSIHCEPIPVQESKIFIPNYDEVIELDDDDDDDFNCSQLFINNQERKSQDIDESLDPYLHIKEELAELDKVDEEVIINQVPFDLELTKNSIADLINDLGDNSVNKEVSRCKPNEPVQLHNDNDNKLHTRETLSNEHLRFQSKYTKPPLIDALPMQITSKRNKYQVSKDVPAEVTKESAIATRKRKLKGLCSKTEEVKKTKKSSAKVVPKVKVSKNRGEFLCQPGPSTSTSVKGKDNFKIPKRSINQETKKDTIIEKKIKKLSFKDLEPKDNSIAIQNGGTRSAIASTNLYLEKPQRLDMGIRNRNVVSNRNHQNINLDDVYNQIVKWSITWLNNPNITPPVNAHAAAKMLLSFNTAKDYRDIISGLMYLELWEYISQTFGKCKYDPFRAIHQSSRILGDIVYWNFEGYLTKEETKNTLKTYDYVLLEFPSKSASTGQRKKLIQFAIVTRVQTHSHEVTNSENPIIPQLCTGRPVLKIEFTLLTKYTEYVPMDTVKVVVQQVANLNIYLKYFKTLKLLQSSSICKLIIHPCIQDYVIKPKERTLRFQEMLNKQQLSIVAEATELCLSSNPGLYLIQGPPGTGKTRLIINLVLQIIFSTEVKSPVILLTAPSNNAVDNLLLKLYELRNNLHESFKSQIKPVRLGPATSISTEVAGSKLDKLVEKDLFKKLKLRSECDLPLVNTDMTSYLKSSFGVRYGFEYKQSEDNILSNANVFCTTLNSSTVFQILNAQRKSNLKFNCCIVDEATQCTEIECLMPIQLGISKFILVGDPKQLPPTVQNLEANTLGFGKSLFQRISNNFENCPNTPIRMLEQQYRMHPEICKFPNRKFYGGKLKSTPIIQNKITPPISPYLLISIKEESSQTILNNGGYTNPEEAKLVSDLIYCLSSTIHKNCRYEIGVLTPYSAQKRIIEDNISNLRLAPHIKVTVNTVDSFQGKEVDIVIISCVRYNANNFLQNEKRLNVALTRAKQGLYLIGNYTLFKNCQILYEIREDAKRRKTLVDFAGYPQGPEQLRRSIFGVKTRTR